jgi:hypothetical protein
MVLRSWGSWRGIRRSRDQSKAVNLAGNLLLWPKCNNKARNSAWQGDTTRVRSVTIADLGRDGMLTLSVLRGSASARHTFRGNWFARTAATEMVEQATP